MASEIFVDTGAFYAMLDPRDPWHEKLKNLSEQKTIISARYVTTDYVLSETLTLLQSRRLGHIADPRLEDLFQTNTCHVVWMDFGRFGQVRRFFAKHNDKQWSFTDCFSFCVMTELKLQQALAADKHFRQAGFETLLVE